MADAPEPRDRNDGLNWLAILVAATAITIANLLVLTWVTRQGWLAGTAFHKPLGARLLVYGALNQALVIAPLACYQWLANRSKRASLAVYLGSILVFSLGSIPILNQFLARGIFVFNGPYSVAWDVAWGAAQYLAALGLCEIFSGITRSQ
jgi:hypothetical protein